MGLRRDSLLSLLSFSSRSSDNGHQSSPHSYRSAKGSEAGEAEDETETSTPLSSPHSMAKSTSSPRASRTAQRGLLGTPPSPLVALKSANSNTRTVFGCPEGLKWEMLRSVLREVSPEYPDFYAVHIDTTKTWYRGYLYNSRTELGKPVPFAVKVITLLGTPATEWLKTQTCSRGLYDSMQVVTLEWLFAIPEQRLPEVQIIQLIDEVRRLTDPKQCVQFMNRVNAVLGLPILARTPENDIMIVGRSSALSIAEDQVAVSSTNMQSKALRKYEVEQWFPRALEVTCKTTETSKIHLQLDQFLLRLHLRYVTSQSCPGSRLSETFEDTLASSVNCTFKHILPASPAHLAKLGRVVIVCEVIDTLTTHHVGVGLVRIDAALQPEGLGRSFGLIIPLYNCASPGKMSGASLYKKIITGAATGVKVAEVLSELQFTVVTKLHAYPPVNLVSSTVNDYLNCTETVFLDFCELVVLKRPSLLAVSANDPFMIRIEDKETLAIPGQDVGIFLKLSAATKYILVELLNGSTVVATNRAKARHLPIAAGSYRIPLFDVTDDTRVIGFVVAQQIYVGHNSLQPPSVIAAILNESLEFSLTALKTLGLTDLRMWLGPLFTRLLTLIVKQNEIGDMKAVQKLFKAFLYILSLGTSDDARYLYEYYTPPRRVLATPLASILIQQYCDLLGTPSSDLYFAFRSHELLGRLLDILGVTSNDFGALTQAFMAFFSSPDVSNELRIAGLQHLDKLYLKNTSLGVAGQIGSILAVASYSTVPTASIEFYWLLARVAKSEPYKTKFGQQLSSLVISLTERFWQDAGDPDQPLEEIRAIMALIMALPKNTLEAPAFLTLCMSVFVANEPSFRAIPSGPLLEPHEKLQASAESERATAVVEMCLVLFELTAPEALPSKGFLNQLEDPLDMVFQLCTCAHIMIESVVPSEWASLNCVLLECALRCTKYAASLLELAGIPEVTDLASALKKDAWMHVFLTLLRLLTDARLNFDLVRVGMKASPLQKIYVDPSLMASGVKALIRLWQALARGARYGGFQVQFYEEHQLWGYVMLLGFNSGSPFIREQVSMMLVSLLEGEHKLYGADMPEAIGTLLLSLDHMFRHIAPISREDPDFLQSFAWPRFESAPTLIDCVGHHLTDAAFDKYGEAFARIMRAQVVLQTLWSAQYSRGTLLALKEVLRFIDEIGANFLYEAYFGHFVDELRALGDDERIGLGLWEGARVYASLDKDHVVAECQSPRLPAQPAGERRKALIALSLQHLAKGKSWKVAEQVMEMEAQWLRDLQEYEQRTQIVTTWLPIVTEGLAQYSAHECNWYLIKFIGNDFGSLAGREFVWETSVSTRLSDAMRTISTMFNKVTCVPRETSMKHEGVGAHIAIRTLEKENRCLVYTKPIYDQHIELTEFETADETSSCGFIEVVGAQVSVLGAAESAIRDLRTKCDKLKEVCSPQRFKQLDLVLSGILNAGVNGGLSRYTDLISTNQELFNAFEELKSVVNEALRVYGESSGEELRGQYELLRERAKQWQNIKSVDSGYF